MRKMVFTIEFSVALFKKVRSVCAIFLRGSVFTSIVFFCKISNFLKLFLYLNYPSQIEKQNGNKTIVLLLTILRSIQW